MHAPVSDTEDRTFVLTERGDTVTENAIARIRVSPEGQEGLRAFLQKRPPSWQAATKEPH